MPSRSHAPFLLCTLSLLAPLAAAAPQTPYSQVDNVVQLPGSVLAPQRTCTGDVDGDAAPDVAVLANGNVFIAFGASVRSNVVQVLPGTGFKDMTLTPRLDPQSRSQIAYTTSSGVFVAGRQPDPQHPDPWVVEQVLAGDTTLQGALLVRSADVDGNGRSDLVVVQANGKTVRVLLRATNGTWSSPLPAFTMATTVSEIAALPYDSDAPLELAIQTAGSARVHELDGTFVVMARNFVTGAAAAMAVMPVPGGYGRVAYLATANGGGYDLHILEHPFGLETLHVGALVPRSLLAADHDSDGDFDLLVDHGASGNLTLLWNDEADIPVCGQPPHHPFACELATQLSLSVGSVGGVTQMPCWTDIDGDDTPDLIVPESVSSGPWKLGVRPRVPAIVPIGGLPGAADEHPVFIQADWANSDATHVPQLRLTLHNVWGDVHSHLEVSIWRKQNGGASGMETLGRYYGLYLRSAIEFGGDPDVYRLVVPVSASTSSPVPNPTPFMLVDNSTMAFSGSDTTLYFVEVRSVQIQAGEIVDGGRKQIAGLALNYPLYLPPGSSYANLLAMPGSWGTAISGTTQSAGFGGNLPGNYKIGGLVPMPAMPTFGPGFVVRPETVSYP